jgi:1-acyl-sn-glycerol-3-phosphate acyltransferase
MSLMSSVAHGSAPLLGRFTVSGELPGGGLPAGGLVVTPNHSSFADTVLMLAALRRAGRPDPVVLAAAGLLQVPVLGRILRQGGTIPVARGTAQAADALTLAEEALRDGRTVLLYPEGRLPVGHRDSADRPPDRIKTGAARLARAAGVPLLPAAHFGARRVASGSRTKQALGWLTAPTRRPRLHVHFGSPLRVDDLPVPEATAQLLAAMRETWHECAAGA